MSCRSGRSDQTAGSLGNGRVGRLCGDNRPGGTAAPLEPTLEPVTHEPALDGCLEGPAGIWLVTLLDGFSSTFDGALGPAAAEATGAAASLAGRAIVTFPAGSSSTGNETS